MDWLKHWNKALDYLEENLDGEISLEELGRLAGCSPYHFQRMFSYLAGVPLKEYIRRRRMTRAAADLRAGDKVLDVALRYGYDSPTAFNRAFQAVHGLAPSAVREPGAAVKGYPPLRFTITVKGAREMEFRIEKREAFRIVGVSVPLESDIEKNFEAVPQVWGRAAGDGTLQRLAALMDGEPAGILGVSVCGDAEQWRYYVAAASSQAAPGLEEYLVPAATWAVFPGSGTSRSLQDLERRIVTEWLPTSGYEYASGPDVEVYLNADPENARYEVWLPVKKSGRD